ncbi:MAG: GNAT family N-acetyltransferase [candidate division WS1 bacterium]|jgi:GNAT superfamily N-acetyltransferase|nr:GNAT family N-acetyltransferase [candidate division WS1 bacterium]
MPDDIVDGPRACGPYELAPTLDLLNLVFCPDKPGMGDFGPHLACEENREQMRILKVNGKIVAHAGVYVSEIETGCGLLTLGGIWAVACHPDYRRRGFAEACMRDAMAHMRKLGCDLGWLGTGINDWYRRFGWENAGQAYVFVMDRATCDLLPELEDCEVREGPWPEVEAMLALHRQSGLGCLRRPEIMRALLGRTSSCCLTASRGEELLGYTLRRGKYLTEYAGPSQIVAGLARETFRRWDNSEAPLSTTQSLGRFEIETPVWEEGFTRLLLDLRLPCSRTWRGMMWIADLPTLLDKLGLSGEISAERTSEGWRLTRGAVQVDLTERQVVKLLFGPEKVTDFAEDLFPIQFYHWPLDWV